jgi:hypothetical protein
MTKAKGHRRSTLKELRAKRARLGGKLADIVGRWIEYGMDAGLEEKLDAAERIL